MAILEVQHIEKHFGDTQVLSDISFSLEEGQALSIIGSSGSGKTRFYVKPQLMQMPSNVSFVTTDPKGTILLECGKMLSRGTPKMKTGNRSGIKTGGWFTNLTGSRC